MGFIRKSGSAARWLLATAWGLALLFALLWLEVNRVFGPTAVRDDLRRPWWTERALSHPLVAVVSGSAGPRLAVVMNEEIDPDGPEILGQITLHALWTAGNREGSRTMFATREVRVDLDTSGVSNADRSRLVNDFLRLQRSWGNSELVDALTTGPNPAVVRITHEIRWGVLFANTRGWTLAWAFAISLVVNTGRVVAWIGSLERRDRGVARLSRGLCPHCEYSLHGLPEPRCPECGHPV